MEKSEIRERTVLKIAEMLRLDDPYKIKDEDTLDEHGADSLDKVEIVMALEEEFGLNIPDEDAPSLKTISEIVDYIYKAKNPDEGN